MQSINSETIHCKMENYFFCNKREGKSLYKSYVIP